MLQRARRTAVIASLATALLLLGVAGIVWRWPRPAKPPPVAREIAATVEPGFAIIETPTSA
jgi:hypothetical protein